MPLQLKIVDAFTDRPFGGNPAAVAVVDRFPPDEWMQLVAREMNLSETAFVVRRTDGSHDLRWFTPATEVDLCGHATLASAAVLGGDAEFHTRSGVLTTARGSSGRIEMDFPADPPAPTDIRLSDAVPAISFSRGRFDLLVEVADAAWLRTWSPDASMLGEADVRGVIITAPGDQPGIDFVSRFFGPRVGVLEDPVTGSAHCVLACHWGDRLGMDDMVGYQASTRGGTVHVRRAGERVILSGDAVIVSEVTMHAEPD